MAYDVITDLGVIYVSDTTPDLLMDIYRPDVAEPTAAIVVMYGTYEASDRADADLVTNVLEELASYGFCVASIDYEVTPDASLPRQTQDLFAAIRFLRGEAATYNIDPDSLLTTDGGAPVTVPRVGVLGILGGAAYATMAARALADLDANLTGTLGGFDAESNAIGSCCAVAGVISSLRIRTVPQGLQVNLSSLLNATPSNAVGWTTIFSPRSAPDCEIYLTEFWPSALRPELMMVAGALDEIFKPSAAKDIYEILRSGEPVDRMGEWAISLVINDEVADGLDNAVAAMDEIKAFFDNSLGVFGWDVTATTDITYATGLEYDLYVPDVTGRVPLVIVVHGGGFGAGDKSDNDVVRMCQKLAARGVVAAAPNYSLVGDFPIPQQDIWGFIRYARSIASDVNHIDEDRIVLLGGSAGALIVTNCAMQGTDSDLALTGVVGGNLGESNLVHGCVPVGGILHSVFLDPLGDQETIKLNDLTNGNVALWLPETYVGSTKPPFYIVHGVLDQIFWYGNAQRVKQTMQDAGQDVTLKLYQNRGHGIDTADAAEVVRWVFDKLPPAP